MKDYMYYMQRNKVVRRKKKLPMEAKWEEAVDVYTLSRAERLFRL